MDLYDIHSYAFKHNISERDIRHTWRNGFAWGRRDRDDGNVDYLVVGQDTRGRLIEILARFTPKGYIVFHALTPPTKKVLRELGLIA